MFLLWPFASERRLGTRARAPVEVWQEQDGQTGEHWVGSVEEQLEETGSVALFHRRCDEHPDPLRRPNEMCVACHRGSWVLSVRPKWVEFVPVFLLPLPVHELSVHHVDASIGLPREVFVVGDDHERCPALFV